MAERPPLDKLLTKPAQKEDLTDDFSTKFFDLLKGKDGKVGSKGDKGDKGDRGERGFSGTDGDTGPIGPQGIQGERGPKGEKGEKGIQGERGLQGIDGNNGKDGSPDTPEDVVKKVNKAKAKIKSSRIEGFDELEGLAKSANRNVQNIASLGGTRQTAIKVSGNLLGTGITTLNFVGATGQAVGDGSEANITTSGGGGGSVNSVTGLNTDNADPANPVVKISVDGVTITGAGTPGSPLVSATGSGTVTSVDVSGGTTGLTTSGGPVTTSGTITLAGTLGVANGGTGTGTAFTQGSVVVAGASGTYTQDNANFFWDATNHRLGIGTATPALVLDIVGASIRQASAIADATNKAFRFVTRNYLNAQNDFLMIFGQSKSTGNTLIIGGGQTGNTAASSVAIFTGTGNNTDIGTSRLAVDSSGNVSVASLTASKVVFTDSSKNLTSTGIGTSSQFIKGDGSLDSTTYGSGTVTTVSVATANGLAGTVANATTTPAITLTTSVNAPVLAGNGTAIAAATTTGTGSTVVLQGSPTITTASLGSSTATTQSPADNSTKLATTAYVDNAVLGQNFKEAAGAATTANLVGTYSNGASGVGATFTYTATGVDTIDGVTLTLGMRVLVKNQTTSFQNGIYTVTTAGAIGVAGILTRAIDADQSTDWKTGDSLFVTAGTTQSATTWAYTGVDSPTIGTDAITFAQTAGQGSFTAGAGITITGNSIAITAPVTVALGGTNATSAGITAFNNITGYSAAGATGTTSTNLVFSTSPTLVTPALGVATATSLAVGGATIGTNGLAVTGHVLVEGVTSTGATGTGKFVFDGTPTLVTPVLGVATATSINKMAITAPATSSTLAVADGKTATINNTLTLAGTDSTTMTFPSTSASVARTDAAQTFTGAQTFSNIVIETPQTVTVSSNAGTCDVTHGIQNFTNSSASAMTITLTTTSAVDGQKKIVRIFDASGVAKAITWVNTENSAGVTAPANSAGSTTIPLSVGFIYNSGTSKWTCVASA